MESHPQLRFRALWGVYGRSWIQSLAMVKKHARGLRWKLEGVGCSWSLRTTEVRVSGPPNPVLGKWHKIQTYLSANGNSTLELLRLQNRSHLIFLSHSIFNLSGSRVAFTYRMFPRLGHFRCYLPGPYHRSVSPGQLHYLLTRSLALVLLPPHSQFNRASQVTL